MGPTELTPINFKDIGPASRALLTVPAVLQWKRNPKKRGRNDTCHCGSGLKFKKCHGDPRNVF